MDEPLIQIAGPNTVDDKEKKTTRSELEELGNQTYLNETSLLESAKPQFSVECSLSGRSSLEDLDPKPNEDNIDGLKNNQSDQNKAKGKTQPSNGEDKASLATEKENSQEITEKTSEDSISETAQQVKQYADYLQLMEERVASLEAKLLKVEGGDDSLKSANKKADKEKIRIRKALRLKWFDFKNKLVDENRVYTLQILIEKPSVGYREQDKTKSPRSYSDIEDEEKNDASMKSDSTKPGSAYAVLVNSPGIFKLFEIADIGKYAPIPTLFVAPFKKFFVAENALRAHLKRLEEKRDGPTNHSTSQDDLTDEPQTGDTTTVVGGSSLERSANNELNKASEPTNESDLTKSAESGEASSNSDEKTTPVNTEVDAMPEDLLDSPDTMQDIRCLLEFIDEYLKPIENKYRDNKNRKVRFADLWYLFKPGEVVYVPLGNNGQDKDPKSRNTAAGNSTEPSVSDIHNERYQEVWRVLHTANGRLVLNTNDDDDPESLKKRERINPFFVKCYHLDFDGREFGPVAHTFPLQPFEGEKDITSLEVYPLRYSENISKIKTNLIENGKEFLNFTSFKPRYYVGRSLVRHPCGSLLEGEKAPKHSEYIDSHVVVDFSEAFQTNPDWIPVFDSLNFLGADPRETINDFGARLWKNRYQQEHNSEEPWYFDYDYLTDRTQTNDFIEQNAILKNMWENRTNDASILQTEDLILLPTRVFAYILRTRKFAQLSISDLREVRPRKDGFNGLKLPKGHKRMVQALVKSHFMAKAFQEKYTNDDYEADLVRGKGNGLIILLHGAPGVGKTSTAECVADANGKLLLPITCGDLGLDAEHVERELDEKFHLAQRWNCVLLLDEADVFLAERDRTDIKRNSLVSVFLRVLEYYTGILFLTTNRVGAFDEAFTSRIHISLYYPPLDRMQTMKIWAMNLDRLMQRKGQRMIIDVPMIKQFAREQYENGGTKDSRWNGRQIRNAFQTATALAEFDAAEANIKRSKTEAPEDIPPILPKLERMHFEIVARASQQFDHYITKTTGHTAVDRAWHRQERADQVGVTNVFETTAIDSYRSGGPMPQQPYQRRPQPRSGHASYQYLDTNPTVQQRESPQYDHFVPNATPSPSPSQRGGLRSTGDQYNPSDSANQNTYRNSQRSTYGGASWPSPDAPFFRAENPRQYTDDIRYISPSPQGAGRPKDGSMSARYDDDDEEEEEEDDY
ncbi:MAG: hypothetical protein M1834_009503 [Cirrosporium novae-zelandiae]|nr:MAG: hypothetical protein M1834_009503 [Cirrosporium novae-zelandiae]